MTKEVIVILEDADNIVSPFAKLPELVRCRDCKHRRSDNESCCFFGVTNPDFFCKWGVRKDGERGGQDGQ